MIHSSYWKMQCEHAGLGLGGKPAWQVQFSSPATIDRIEETRQQLLLLVGKGLSAV